MQLKSSAGKNMKDENTKKELFETMPIPKAVASMCIPSIIGSLVMLVYSAADTYFVGMLNSAVETSAVTLASPVILAFNAINNLFGVGSSSLISRSLGAKDYDTARKASAFGIYGALISGICFSALFLMFRPFLLHLLGADDQTFDATGRYVFWTVICGAVPSILNVVMGYLVRAEGAAMHASIGTMSGCILNMILDPFFILPRFLNMGAAGAGLATFISNLFAVGYFLILILVKREKTVLSLRPADFFCRVEGLAGKVCTVGIPAAIQNLLNVTGQTVLNNFAAGYGPVVVSAIGISHKIVMVPLMLSIGISNGVMPLVSYSYTNGNRPRMKGVLLHTIRIAMAITLILMAAFLLLAEPLIAMFMKDPGIIRYGGAFLRIACIQLPFMAMDFIAVGVFQALGMGKRALLFAVLRKIILEIPALLLWNKLLPVYGLPAAQPTAEFVLGITAVFMLRKILQEKPAGPKERQADENN